MCFKGVLNKVSGGLLYPVTTEELISPLPRIGKANVAYYQATGKLEVTMPEVMITGVSNTNSMEPVVDIGHTVLLAKLGEAYQYKDLVKGDIVTFYDAQINLVMHRIIDIQVDVHGRKYTTRGDNVNIADPYILRDLHLLHVLVGVLY